MNWVYHGEFFRSGKRLVRTVRSITCGAAEYNRSIADTCVRRRRCLSRFHHHRGRCITRKIGAQTKKRRHWPKCRASGSTTLAVSRGTYYLFPRSKLGRARAHAGLSCLCHMYQCYHYHCSQLLHNTLTTTNRSHYSIAMHIWFIIRYMLEPGSCMLLADGDPVLGAVPVPLQLHWAGEPCPYT